jgi:glycosyltransferase involved in cell wall biosynthesis
MTTPALNVLHVILSLDPGGLERVVIDLVREAPTVNQQASILCIDSPGVLAPQAEAVAKIYCASKGPGLHWSAVGKIRSILEELRPDVVHTHQVTALFYLAPISRKLMPVLVHTEHNNQLRRYRTTRERLTYLAMLFAAGPRADRIFAVSDDARESIRRTHIISANKLFTVPNGINLERFQPDSNHAAELRATLGIPPDSIVFGNIGRLNEMKRPDILVKVFAKLISDFPDIRLLMVGDGPLMSELRNQTVNLNIAHRVHFAGFQRNPELYLRALDIFVLTSRMEGMPLAVIEAQASGVPVIASNVGGLAEMSNKGRSMLLYAFNDVNTLLDYMRRMILDVQFRQALAEAGRQYALSNYSASRMARDYSAHYSDLIEQGRCGG